jgi:cell filamentation protein
MFDPFRDFETAGYLRNVRRDKIEADIKHFEHNLFRANLEEALDHLATQEILSYRDFLEVHRILFSNYYPWAGQDRAVTLPNSAVRKGDVLFAHPQAARWAVNEGLRLGQNKAEMNKRPGEIMGLFAYGHPFLDGNGRTMLLVHLELSYRAGFSLFWAGVRKADYLDALTREIAEPGHGILDGYLEPFKRPPLKRGHWVDGLLSMKGLDGLGEANRMEGDFNDLGIAEKYRNYDERRSYSIKNSSRNEQKGRNG